MLLGLILSATGIVLFAWAMFRLAVFALPVGLGAATFLWAAGGELGLLLGLLLGLVVGVAASSGTTFIKIFSVWPLEKRLKV